MLPKPPRPSDGPSALDAYREVLELHETTLRNRFDREFYRKELRAKAKYYGTLAGKHPEGGEARVLSTRRSRRFLAHQLDVYGPEAPVKRRRKADAPTAPLVYPDLARRAHLSRPLPRARLSEARTLRRLGETCRCGFSTDRAQRRRAALDRRLSCSRPVLRAPDRINRCRGLRGALAGESRRLRRMDST